MWWTARFAGVLFDTFQEPVSPSEQQMKSSYLNIKQIGDHVVFIFLQPKNLEEN